MSTTSLERAACITCGHPDPHTGGGIGVCLHEDCGCDGPVTEADARVAAQYDNPEPLRSEVPWVPARTVEASVTINVRHSASASGMVGAAYSALLDQLAVQAGGAHNLDLGSGFEVTITVKAWKHP